jgi:phospholipase/carboxylesterase
MTQQQTGDRSEITMLDTVFIPASEGKTPYLMVVLHGLGDSTAGYEWLPHALDLSRMNYLLVNAPDEYYGGYSWFEFPGDPTAGIARSRKLLAELLEHQQTLGYSADKTFLFGFSQGCLMVIEMGIRYPQVFAGIVGISGFLNQPETLLREASPVCRQQRFLITHGTFDPVLPFEVVKPLMQRLTAHGLQIEWHEFPKEHTIAGEPELRVIREFARRGLK